METIELFSARVCPFAHRSRLALTEKGIPYTLITIDLKNKPEWYHEVNPSLAVPALRQGDFLLQESLIINEYVNDLAPEPPLLPTDPQQRATARLWIDFAGSKLIPPFYKLLKAQDAETQAAASEALLGALSLLDEELKKRKKDGPYWFGWQVGLTDIALYPWFERWPVLEHYRGLQRPTANKALENWIAAMQQREAVRINRQPDDYYIAQYADYAGASK